MCNNVICLSICSLEILSEHNAYDIEQFLALSKYIGLHVFYELNEHVCQIIMKALLLPDCANSFVSKMS